MAIAMMSNPPDHAEGPDGTMMTAAGHVKWFDRKRGFGFIVPDCGGPDILVHCSVIEALGRRDLPEQARLTCQFTDGPRGRHATALDNLDLSTALDRAGAAARPHRRLRAIDPATPYVAGTVKWFSRVRGYGFLEAEGCDVDVFIHMETLRDAGFGPAAPGDRMLIQIGAGARGPMAVDIRGPDVSG